MRARPSRAAELFGNLHLELRGVDALGFRDEEASFEHLQLQAQSLVRSAKLIALVNQSGDRLGVGGASDSLPARNVQTKAEVDAALEAARKAGAKILKPAEQAFWGGYSGYFADPDDHPWEVAYNPHWKLDAEGRVVLPR